MSHFSADSLACLRGDRLVFAHLDFSVPTGGALLLIGANGSGKSSLLRLLAGLSRPFRGHIRWNGASIADDADAHRRRTIYVGHADAIKPALTVRESLRFWAGMAGVADPSAVTASAIERASLERIADVPGRLLSAGQKRRAGLARLLAIRAQLWLLDEPTVALDRAAVERLEGMIADHRAAGGIIIASTHAPIALPGADRLDLDGHQVDPEASLMADGADEQPPLPHEVG